MHVSAPFPCTSLSFMVAWAAVRRLCVVAQTTDLGLKDTSLGLWTVQGFVKNRGHTLEWARSVRASENRLYSFGVRFHRHGHRCGP